MLTYEYVMRQLKQARYDGRMALGERIDDLT
jgi:hypothetical protein